MPPPSEFDFSLIHYDNEDHCNLNDNTQGLTEIAYFKFDTRYSYKSYKVEVDSCSDNHLHGIGDYKSTVPVPFTVKKSQACQGPVSFGTTVFKEPLTFGCFH
jgi:hypothetical protein